MDALGMLNALIGVVLVYFVLSLIVSAVVEWITQLRGYRGDVLEQATARLLGLDEAPQAASLETRPLSAGVPPNKAAGSRDSILVAAFHAFFNHPQIQVLQQDPKRRPSYVPTPTFATAFAECALDMTIREMRSAPALLRDRIESLPSPLNANLRALLDDADGDPVKFLGNIESWVEKTWDRAAGWLRRKINWRLFLVGFAVALFVNADTVRMFQVLTRDARLQQSLVEVASKLAEQGSRETLDQVLCGPAAGDAGRQGTQASPAAGQVHSSTEPAASTGPATGAKPSDVSCSDLQAARHYALDVSPLLGWDRDWSLEKNPWWWYMGKLVGLLITASALLMGAPFWFDMLKKLISVRQSLRPQVTPATSEPAQGAPQATQVATSGAAASSAPAIQSVVPSSFDFQPHATSYRPENALWMSRFCALAYSEQSIAEAQGSEWGYKIVGKFDAAGNDTQYLIAERADALILAFRGTEPSHLADVLSDVQFEATPCVWQEEAKLHKGFLAALDCEWKRIVAALKTSAKGRALWITGHSLGGALALLAAHRLSCTEKEIAVCGVVTFGQPRCGDATFAEDVVRKLAGRYWRAVNSRDVVPRTPPYAMGFRHAGTLVYVDDLGRVAIDPPLWYRALDNLDLPVDKAALRRALSERIGDHSIDRYTQTLANAYRRMP